MRLQTALFTPAEVFDAQPQLRGHPLLTLDCVICGEAPRHRVAYFAIIVNHSIGVANVGAVCERCSEGCPREELEVVVESTMRLVLAPAEGHA